MSSFNNSVVVLTPFETLVKSVSELLDKEDGLNEFSVKLLRDMAIEIADYVWQTGIPQNRLLLTSTEEQQLLQICHYIQQINNGSLEFEEEKAFLFASQFKDKADKSTNATKVFYEAMVVALAASTVVHERFESLNEQFAEDLLQVNKEIEKCNSYLSSSNTALDNIEKYDLTTAEKSFRLFEVYYRDTDKTRLLLKDLQERLKLYKKSDAALDDQIAVKIEILNAAIKTFENKRDAIRQHITRHAVIEQPSRSIEDIKNEALEEIRFMRAEQKNPVFNYPVEKTLQNLNNLLKEFLVKIRQDPRATQNIDLRESLFTDIQNINTLNEAIEKVKKNDSLYSESAMFFLEQAKVVHACLLEKNVYNMVSELKVKQDVLNVSISNESTTIGSLKSKIKQFGLNKILLLLEAIQKMELSVYGAQGDTADVLEKMIKSLMDRIKAASATIGQACIFDEIFRLSDCQDILGKAKLKEPLQSGLTEALTFAEVLDKGIMLVAEKQQQKDANDRVDKFIETITIMSSEKEIPQDSLVSMAQYLQVDVTTITDKLNPVSTYVTTQEQPAAQRELNTRAELLDLCVQYIRANQANNKSYTSDTRWNLASFSQAKERVPDQAQSVALLNKIKELVIHIESSAKVKGKVSNKPT